MDDLLELLETGLQDFTVVVMPDFFLDRIVTLNQNSQTFTQTLLDITKRKGGSIDGIAQADIRGGNAVNTASALAALGCKVVPIIVTSSLGARLLRVYLRSNRIDLSHVKIMRSPSVTTALEVETPEGKTNVMLRNLGSLAEFGPKNLSDKDFQALKEADYVCVFNWAGTRRHGTNLAKTVFSITKKKGKGKTYYDTADPNPNRGQIPALVREVLSKPNLDILSLNENEAMTYARHFTKKENRNLKNTKTSAHESARILAGKLHARIDLHTAGYSTSFNMKGETTVRAFKVKMQRATGAGDAWNAGNIISDALKLPDTARLKLANAVAAYYVSNTDGKHPSEKELAAFLRKHGHSTS